jgi:plastocyanin
MKRLLIILAGFSLAIPIMVGLATTGSAATRSVVKAPTKATVTIRHQMRGCHTWSVNGNAYRAAQSASLARGGTIMFIDNDVMSHKLIQTRGPAVRYSGNPAMSHMGASVKALFPRAGVYRFKTRAGEDYTSGIKTIGEDNVLRLTVTVA